MKQTAYIRRNKKILLLVLPGIIFTLLILNISLGSVHIPIKELWKLMLGDSENIIYTNIIIKSRIPQTITACLAGAALSVSGLILQTMFKNPLAGPSVLGINSGAGLGVALVTLFFAGTYQISSYGSMMHLSTLLAAFIGAVLIMLIILLMAAKVKNNAMLLIIGLMVGYITSSVVSVLKYYSMQENIHAFVMWGLGSFSNTGWQDLRYFIPVVIVGLFLSLLAVKSLNMLNLGERYAQNLGLNIKSSRLFIISVTSILASVVTAFCGPIAFLGLAVPHISRLLSHSTDHKILIPHTMLTGAMLALLCNLLARMPWTDLTLPINAVTSIFGAPVVIYIILKKKPVMTELLKTQDLSIGYFDKNNITTLHKNINLKLNCGELICLLGPNGAGKSTLLRSLAGIQQVIDGKVQLLNKNISAFSTKDLSRQIGLVLTDRNFSGMRVVDLVSLGRYPYTGFFARLSKKDYKIVVEVLQQTGLLKFKHKLINELSDGEQQRVMIARVLAQKTPLIILDEPTAFLDLPGRYEVFQMLVKLAHEQGKTVLLSTHDLDLAIKFADKIWLIGKEKPFVSGIPEDLILSGQFAYFFDNSNLRFDLQSGTFEVSEEKREAVCLNGDGPEALWVSKALNRKGYYINNKPGIPINIDIEKAGQYILNKESKQTKVESIESLLDLLH